MIHTIQYLIVSIVDVYSFILFVYIIMSWIPMKSGFIADVDAALGRICDPYLGIFRRIIPPIGMVDVSPILAFVVLQLVARLVVAIL